MSPRTSLVALAIVVACGGGERHDSTTPGEDEGPSCPSSAAPDKCRDLAASAGNTPLAWAYTVLECESPGASQCVAMWQRYSKLAPTQTDALNVLHAACSHQPAACQQLSAWHAERGHVLAAAAYQHVEAAHGSGAPRSGNTLALATELGTALHVAAPVRTEPIAQMVGHALHAPSVVAKPTSKAWPMSAAELGVADEGCTPTGLLDRHQVSLDKCISEVRPLEADQIAIRNRCGTAVSVAFSGLTGNRTTSNQLTLDRYEALSIGLSHKDIGKLKYAVCGGACRVTGSEAGQWTANDPLYNCSKR
jgi:hypothetical protein